ncbi:MAG TPA: TMEM175 family protein [Tepidiformaceae bacterium]|nr:TMEM175 family protein [Tepidiformaceae bacterium]
MQRLSAIRDSGPERLIAFSDGVMAVIITIMALELRPPAGTDLHDLVHRAPALLIYALSFAIIGIYWNNHHHLLRATERISGAVMWSNLHLLFWLSLFPVATEWIGEEYRHAIPAATWGVIALGSAIAYLILVRALVRVHDADSRLAVAMRGDLKGRISESIYIAGVALAFLPFGPWLSYACYVAVAVIWFVPDRRLAD